MALKGEDKKRYQREYMRKRRSNNPVRPKALDLDNPVRPSDETKQKKLAELRQFIANSDALRSTRSPLPRQSSGNLPLYNHLVHKAGDKVLMDVGGVLREVVVPNLDVDGNEIERGASSLFAVRPTARPPNTVKPDLTKMVTMFPKPPKRGKKGHR